MKNKSGKEPIALILCEKEEISLLFTIGFNNLHKKILNHLLYHIKLRIYTTNNLIYKISPIRYYPTKSSKSLLWMPYEATMTIHIYVNGKMWIYKYWNDVMLVVTFGGMVYQRRDCEKRRYKSYNMVWEDGIQRYFLSFIWMSAS